MGSGRQRDNSTGAQLVDSTRREDDLTGTRRLWVNSEVDTARHKWEQGEVSETAEMEERRKGKREYGVGRK